MCGSGTRAGFVKSALEQLGYTNVHNIGGISSYNGDYKVLGGLEENRLKFAANVYTVKHWTPKRDLESPVYVMFEAEVLGYTKYQIVFTSCT
ncbi:rhodanese-like domain-containing protein [Mycoplasmatota bacterium WC44]